MKIRTKAVMCSVPLIGYAALAYVLTKASQLTAHLLEREFNDEPSPYPLDYVHDTPVDDYLRAAYDEHDARKHQHD